MLLLVCDVRLNEPITQEAFGSLVGITQSSVSRLQAEGILPEPLVAGAALLAYCHRLREQAAGRLGGTVGGLDLAQERAALARAQRMLAEDRLAVLRGESAPITLLAEVLATASQAVAQRFDHLPARIRRACPDLPSAASDVVVATIAEARNQWVLETVALVSNKVVSTDEAEDDNTTATAEPV